MDIPVGCLNDVKIRAHHSATITLKSKVNDYENFLSFLVIPKIAEQLLSYQIDKASIEIPRNIKLADPEFFKPSNVQALIGAKVFYKLLCILSRTTFLWGVFFIQSIEASYDLLPAIYLQHAEEWEAWRTSHYRRIEYRWDYYSQGYTGGAILLGDHLLA